MPIWRYVEDGDCVAVSDGESDDSSSSSSSSESNGVRRAKLHFDALILVRVHVFSERHTHRPEEKVELPTRTQQSLDFGKDFADAIGAWLSSENISNLRTHYYPVFFFAKA